MAYLKNNTKNMQINNYMFSVTDHETVSKKKHNTTMRNNFRLFVVISSMLTFLKASSNILMVTMGGTKSHKIPFMELANGLLSRGHQVTFIHAFPDYDSYVALSKNGNYSDLTPQSLVTFVSSFTDWDLLGSRMKGHDPVPPLKAFEYAFKVIF